VDLLSSPLSSSAAVVVEDWEAEWEAEWEEEWEEEWEMTAVVLPPATAGQGVILAADLAASLSRRP